LGALAAGCPQVVFPLFADQGANARCVAAAGVGLALMDDTPGGPPAIRRARDGDDVRMRSAIEQVLSNVTYAAHAARVASSMANLPTGDEVVPELISPSQVS
jgi:UDP:flavonoid glycosyltransferase YjiC (YdhE family)